MTDSRTKQQFENTKTFTKRIVAKCRDMVESRIAGHTEKEEKLRCSPKVPSMRTHERTTPFHEPAEHRHANRD